MKATELMIGDWVNAIAGEVGKVAFISSTGFVNVEIDESSAIEIFDPQPIPLTEEILEKNGFKNMGFFGKCEIGLWTLLCDTKTICIIHGDHTNIDTPIEYVHELQHALRLCRIEKEIVL